MLIDIFKSFRPKQWVKNFFVFATLLFSRNFLDYSMFLRVSYIFLIFCALSSSVYLINDVIDRKKDSNHPKKRFRPIAAGRVPVWIAVTLSIVLSIVSLLLAFKLNLYTGVVALVYFIQSVAYSLYFKNVVIIDVLIVAVGYVLRAIAGGTTIEVGVSVWLLISITLLSLFLPLCKRRHEVNLVCGNTTRKVLKEYTVGFLDQLISIVTSSTIVVYSLYTFMSNTRPAEHRYLMLTIPFVVYGIFRYLFLVYTKDLGGEPEEIVLKDKPIIVNILLWVLTAGIVLYI